MKIAFHEILVIMNRCISFLCPFIYVKLSTITMLVYMPVSCHMWIKEVLTEAVQEESPSLHHILTTHGEARHLASSAGHQKPAGQTSEFVKEYSFL